MVISSLYATKNFLKLDVSENFIEVMNKYYSKALDNLSNTSQKNKLLSIYQKLKVEEMNNNDLEEIKNIDPSKVDNLNKNYKKLIIEQLSQ